MKIILTSIFVFSFTNLFAQEECESKYRFAKEVFQSQKYQKKDYKKFDKKVEYFDDNCYVFGDKFIKLLLRNKGHEQIFTLGIFNPDLIFGAKTFKKSKIELDALSENQKALYSQIRNDSLTISSLEEIYELNPNHQTKRFKFWLFRFGVFNPSECYFELYNKEATEQTTLEEFIGKAKMTFYFEGTIII